MSEPFVFESPAPVEVAEFAWLEDVPATPGEFEEVFRVLNLQITLDFLRNDTFDDDTDYLREAGLVIGEALQEDGHIDESSRVTLRSGLYGGKETIYDRLGFHYDLNPVIETPSTAFVIASAVGSTVAVGDVRERVDDVAQRPEGMSFTMHQASLAERGECAFDLSDTDITTLEPNKVYYLPKYCVHTSPRITEPVARHFMRYKTVSKVQAAWS